MWKPGPTYLNGRDNHWSFSSTFISERFLKTCAICEDQGKESRASVGACMACSKTNCKTFFHVTCAQSEGLLCEEQNTKDVVTYCGYCPQHYRCEYRMLVKADPFLWCLFNYFHLISLRSLKSRSFARFVHGFEKYVAGVYKVCRSLNYFPPWSFE